MDYPKNARKTRGKEEYCIVQSLQLQPLLCRPRDRRSAVSGTSLNGRGAVSGPSFNRRSAVSGAASDDQATIIHCSGRALCRPRTQRTCKYHANAYPPQGVAPCGLPQAVMIHNLLVGCRNLCSSLEEVDSLLTPDKTSGTSAVWGYEIAQSISLEGWLTSLMHITVP